MQRLFFPIIRTTFFPHACKLLIAVFCTYSAYGRTELFGNIGGRNFTAEEGPYVVVRDISVPEGGSVTIGEGCRFFFAPFTGIQVSGTLIVEGTPEQPVIFTSIYDSLSPDKNEQLPNPFDWNGILLTSRSENVSLTHFTLTCSVYGIKSQNNSLVIDNGIFRQNGQYHFTMMDKPMPVADGIPYSYRGNSVGNAPGDMPSGKNGKRKEWNVSRKKGVPALIGVAGVGSGVVSLVYIGKWFDLRDNFLRETEPERRKDIEDDGKRLSQIAAGTGTFSIAAITTGVVLFWRWNFREDTGAEVLPLIVPGGGGFAVTVNVW